jgi:hypothetical protein
MPSNADGVTAIAAILSTLSSLGEYGVPLTPCADANGVGLIVAQSDAEGISHRNDERLEPASIPHCRIDSPPRGIECGSPEVDVPGGTSVLGAPIDKVSTVVNSDGRLVALPPESIPVVSRPLDGRLPGQEVVVRVGVDGYIDQAEGERRLASRVGVLDVADLLHVKPNAKSGSGAIGPD